MLNTGPFSGAKAVNCFPTCWAFYEHSSFMCLMRLIFTHACVQTLFNLLFVAFRSSFPSFYSSSRHQNVTATGMRILLRIVCTTVTCVCKFVWFLVCFIVFFYLFFWIRSFNLRDFQHKYGHCFLKQETLSTFLMFWIMVEKQHPWAGTKLRVAKRNGRSERKEWAVCQSSIRLWNTRVSREIAQLHPLMLFGLFLYNNWNCLKLSQKV